MLWLSHYTGEGQKARRRWRRVEGGTRWWPRVGVFPTLGLLGLRSIDGSYTYPNGVSTTLQYDSLNRLTNLAASGQGSAIANYAYTLGAAGNRTGVTELSGRKVGYSYDNLYRLTSETISNDVSGMRKIP